MRVLVTGADGFVGTHLCQELADHGHQVYPTDKADRDLSQPYMAEGAVRRVRPDYVVHLAARYGRLLCRDQPHRSVADNTASTTELAAVCAEREIPVLYTSSSEIYGDHGTRPISEDSELRMPTTIYGLSKRWGEEVLALYLPPQRQLVVRMNMLYGPEQVGGYGRCSLATFVKHAVEGKPFVVHRNTSRSWLYISDAVRALRQLVEGGHHGTYNLGNPAPSIPMTTVALELAKQTGQVADVQDPPPGQIAHKIYDCRKLLRTIRWQPRVGLEEGIAKTLEWARMEHQLEAAA